MEHLPALTYAPAWGLKLVRRVRRLRHEELAAATGLPSELIAEYESERQPLPFETLVHVITALRLTEEEHAALLHATPRFDLDLWRGGPMDMPRQNRAVIRWLSQEVGERVRKFVIWRMMRGGTSEEIAADIALESARGMRRANVSYTVAMMVLQPRLRAKARRVSPRDRRKGEEAWGRFEAKDLSLLRLIAESGRDLASWAVCERLGLAAVELAGTAPDKSRDLAEITLLLVRKAHVGPAMRRRLRGFAAACLGTARLALGDRAGAEEALAETRRLWQAGAAASTKILSDIPLRTLETALASCPTAGTTCGATPTTPA
jgi:hypothetical protein